MKTKREPTENEKGLHEVLNNGYLAPEIRNARMWKWIEAIINENMQPALSSARDAALEEAKTEVRAVIADGQSFDLEDVLGRLTVLQSSPAAAIPTDRDLKRNALEALASTQNADWKRGVAALADACGVNVDDALERALGVGLDAKAGPAYCGGNGTCQQQDGHEGSCD